MENMLQAERFAELWQAGLLWIQANVLVVANLVQLATVALALALAYLINRILKSWLAARHGRLALSLRPFMLAIVWLSLQWLAIGVAARLDRPHHLLEIVASLLTAWVIIRLVSQLARDPVWAHLIAWSAWTIAALNILNLLAPAIALLDSAAFVMGGLRISLYTVVKSTIALAVLLSAALYLSGVLDSRIKKTTTFSPSVQVLLGKSLRIVLISLAILMALRSVGIDLTALTVLGGAIGLGIGFGLQKIIGNLISGVILLVDRSIKPGDVIAVGNTYGWVTTLGGRYVSVVTRDGIEHLIPNETLITERVENWTHSNSQTRPKIPLGVHYKSDVRKAIEICIDAASNIERVLKDPEPVCLLKEFGDSSVDLEIRIWIDDAHNGISNVKSQVLLKIWDGFHEHGIEIPYPQRDLHVRTPDNLRPVFDHLAELGAG